jgi:ADP-L-glycero-D-manno-heptose 6-epimerase
MILITGTDGFIGQHLLQRFPQGGIYYSEKQYCFDDLYEGINWEEIKQIWHLGAITDTTETDINKIHKYNIDYTIKLLNNAIDYQIPVKYASSAAVYGNTNYRREINPLNYYALSKATIDRFVEDNIDKFSKIQGYRFFNVFGKHESHKGDQASPVYKFTKQARETGTIKLFEKSNACMRDFIWVEDVIDCMFYDKPSGIYDLGTGVARSFERVAQLVAEKECATIECIPFPKHLENKYQYFTCSLNHFIDHKFLSIEEYLLRNDNI